MERPHILLISLETIRRDHLRIHGYPKDLAPHLANCLSPQKGDDLLHRLL